MPAQTHGRARNGFHILANSRGRLTNLNKAPCDTDAACEKAYCCGPAIQPAGMKPQGCRRGLCSFTHNRGRKRALALGGVGSRSSTIKRAITRRVQNRNQMPVGYEPSATKPRNAKEWPTKDAVVSPLPCHHITVPKINDRDVSLGLGVPVLYRFVLLDGIVKINPNYWKSGATWIPTAGDTGYVQKSDGTLYSDPSGKPYIYTIVDNSTIGTALASNTVNLCTTLVTIMRELFYFDGTQPNYLANNDISDWDVGAVTDMYSMFYDCANMNQTLGKWNVSSVTNMNSMFYNCTSFVGDANINSWVVKEVTDMGNMFYNAQVFNQPIGDWNVASVTNMNNMFAYAQVFNQPIGDWNVSNVENMTYMFAYTQDFNQPIGNWNVTSVIGGNSFFEPTAMAYMFYAATGFDNGETSLVGMYRQLLI